MEVLLYVICAVLAIWWIVQLIRGEKTIEDTKDMLRYFVCSLFWFAVAKLLHWLFGATFMKILASIIIVVFLALLVYGLCEEGYRNYRRRHRRK